MADHGTLIQDRRPAVGTVRRPGRRAELIRSIRATPLLYLMIAVVMAWAILFHFIPIWGISFAFRRFNLVSGFWSADWVGFKYFAQFLSDPFAFRIIRNTVLLGFWSIVFTFPAPIVFALLLNEIGSSAFKRSIQTLTYLPHFVSTVVIVGIIFQLFEWERGIATDIIELFTGERRDVFIDPRWFRPLYVVSSIWQELGWGTIIYLAALAGVNAELYEAARVDGAGRWQQALHVTVPALIPTITILFILNTRNLVQIGFEKAFLLQNPGTYETGDIIATYVYRRGIEGLQFSYATAIGLLNSVMAFAIVLCTHKIVQRLRGEGLW